MSLATLAPAERIAAARKAQVEWAARPHAERSAVLRAMRHALVRRMDEAVGMLAEEVGKPALDALTGDLMVTLEHLRLYERTAARVLRTRTVAKPRLFYMGARFAERHEPFGVVLVLAPWNYPVQLALVPAVTALAAGNAVVLKCSEHTPRTAAWLAEVAREAGVPATLLQVSAEEPAAAAALVEARPDLIFLTGSTASGRAVAERAAALLIPTVLELGGKDPALVFRSAPVERTARGLVYAAFSNAGQVCVGARRIYVEQGVYEPFLQSFLMQLKQLRTGTALDADLGPVRVKGVRERLVAQVQDALAQGAHLLHGSLDGDEPFVLIGVPPGAKLLTEESFGPVVVITPVRDEREAVEQANSTPWALSGSVWTGDKAQGQRVAGQLRAGSCSVNDAIRHIGNPHAAFGGNGASGWGRYHGEQGLRAFSRTKTVMTVQARGRGEVHWFPFRAATVRTVRAMLRARHGQGAWPRRWLRLLRGGLPSLVVCLAGLAHAQRGSAGGDLKVRIGLPAGAHGQLGYLVFNSADGFPDTRDRAFRHDFVPLGDGRQPVIDIGKLPPGQYAVTVYLDTNNNHKLDKGLFGIPKEPVGGSNNPKSRMGPPSFRDCAFAHGAADQVIDIHLVH